MRVKAPAIAIAALVVLAPLTGAALLWCFKLIVDEKLVGRRTVKVSAAQLVELLAQASGLNPLKCGVQAFQLHTGVG